MKFCIPNQSNIDQNIYQKLVMLPKYTVSFVDGYEIATTDAESTVSVTLK